MFCGCLLRIPCRECRRWEIASSQSSRSHTPNLLRCFRSSNPLLEEHPMAAATGRVLARSCPNESAFEYLEESCLEAPPLAQHRTGTKRCGRNKHAESDVVLLSAPL